MRRVSCLEVEVLGARAPVCKSEDVIIMYGLDCVCAMLIAQVKYNRVCVCVCVRERERESTWRNRQIRQNRQEYIVPFIIDIVL